MSMDTGNTHAEVSSAEKARSPRANAKNGVRAQADMGPPSGLARRASHGGPIPQKKGAKFYIYRLTDEETGEYYIGRRSSRSKAKPENDKYMGSGVWPAEARKAGRKLRKDIIAEFRKFDEVQRHEAQLIANAQGDPLNKNRHGRSDYWKNERFTRIRIEISVPTSMAYSSARDQMQSFVERLLRKYVARLAKGEK